MSGNMAVQLPHMFTERMNRLLGDQFESFMQSYEQSPHAGLRVNTLKISMEQFKEIAPFDLRPIPWCETGFYVPHGVKPGLHPYYHAGLYYIQEPSAMAPVEQLQVQPGDRVLDLCAAPGGNRPRSLPSCRVKVCLSPMIFMPSEPRHLPKILNFMV